MGMQTKAEKVDFDSLWNYDNPAETEAKFREILPEAKNSGDIGYYAELLTQIARAEGLAQKFDEAHALLDTVKGLLPTAGGRAYIRYLLERGRVFNSSGKPGDAAPLFVEAWERSLKGGFDSYAVDAAHMMGIVAPAEKQMGWNMEALDLAERSPDPMAQKWKGSLYNNVGWTYFERKDYDSALMMFQKAVALRKVQGKPGPIRIGEWCVAKTLRYLGRIKEALVIQQRLQKEWDEAGADNDGYVYEELGECLLALNRGKEAVPHFARAYELLSKDVCLVRDEPARLQRMKELGQVR